MNINFTETELFEINDAIAEVIVRMCHKGQTKQELEYASLRVMWEVKKKITRAICGHDDTPGIRDAEASVLRAIENPRVLARERAYRDLKS